MANDETNQGNTNQVAVLGSFHHGRPQQIIRLNGKNYSSWKMIVRRVLMNRRLASVVFDDEDASLTPEQKFQKDSEAWEILITSMEQAVVDKVVVCQTAREIWERLQGIYEQEGDANLTTNFIQFFTMSMGSTEEMADFIARLEQLVDKIKAQGESLSDKLLQANLLRGLTSDYSVFRQVWDGTPTKSFKILKDRLILEEANVKARRASDSTPSHSALFNKEQKKKFYKDNDHSSDKKKDSECNYCGIKGHWANVCRKKKRDKEVRSNNGHSSNPNSRESHHNNNRNVSFMMKTGMSTTTEWYADSGSTGHLCKDKGMFQDISVFSKPLEIMVGNKQTIYAYGTGSILLESDIDGDKINVTVNNVLYVPEAAENLISIGVIRKKIRTTFVDDKCLFHLQTSDQQLVMVGKYQQSGLYLLNVRPLIHKVLLNKSRRTITDWHESLGHVNAAQIQSAIENNLVEGASIATNQDNIACCVCPQGKATNVSHSATSRELAKEVGEMVHLDLIGRLPKSLGNNEYGLVLTDEASNYRTFYAIKTKDMVVEKLEEYFSMVECQSGRKVKCLWSDCGSEFVNHRVKTLLAIEHATLLTSAPRTPQQNGRAERSNRTIVEAARTMLASGKLPESLWAEACTSAVYVLNRIGKSNDPQRTPFEFWFGRKPNISHIHPFGTQIQVLDKPRTGSKWAPKTQAAFLVGFTERVNTYRCFILSLNTIRITSDVIFRQHPSPTFSSDSFGGIDNQPSFVDLPSTSFNHSDMHKDVSQQISRISRTNQTHEQISDTAPSYSAEPKDVLSAYFRKPNKHGGRHSDFGNETNVSIDPPCPEFSLLSNDSEVTHDSNKQSTPSDKRKDMTFAKSKPTVMGSVAKGLANLLNLPNAKANNNPDSKQLADSNDHDKSVTQVPSSTAIDTSIPANDMIAAKYTTGGVSYMYLNTIDPVSYQQAIESKDKNKWLQAIDEERIALEQNNTWSVVRMEDDVYTLSSRWVFTTKYLPCGEIERYKARLVIRGFTQRPGLDYSETFAPVVHLESIRILFALITHYKLETIQFDIQTAFLNGDLEEDIYIKPPEGIKCPPNHVFKLNKSLYGLKQAPRCWKTSFDKILHKLNFEPLLADPCLFTGEIKSHRVLLAVYVDDGLAASSSKEALTYLFRLLADELKIRKVKTNKFVGLEFERSSDKRKLILHQRGYITKILNQYNMSDCKPDKNPINDTHELQTKREHEKVTQKPYREIMGSLLYAACLTRPDILFAVSFLSRYSSEPKDKHWTAAMRILRYLRGSINLGIEFVASDSLDLDCYTDADWGGDLSDRKSTSGVICLLSNGPILFKSKKQTVVAQSTTEAEYYAANLGVREILGTKNLLDELGVKITNTTLNSDNQSAIKLIKNSEYHQNTKHISIREHLIRDHYKKGLFQLNYVTSEEQKADMLTKSLTPTMHQNMIKKIGLTTITLMCLLATCISCELHVEDLVVWSETQVAYI